MLNRELTWRKSQRVLDSENTLPCGGGRDKKQRETVKINLQQVTREMGKHQGTQLTSGKIGKVKLNTRYTRLSK